jgi:hypothetical protein
MSKCDHEKLRSWVDAETLAPVGMWSCVDCGHNFEPVNLEKERAAEDLRAALQEADTIMGHDDEATEWRERWAHLWGETEALRRRKD